MKQFVYVNIARKEIIVKDEYIPKFTSGFVCTLASMDATYVNAYITRYVNKGFTLVEGTIEIVQDRELILQKAILLLAELDNAQLQDYVDELLVVTGVDNVKLTIDATYIIETKDNLNKVLRKRRV